MTTKDTDKQKGNAKNFEHSGEVIINGKKYLIERHFTGKRDYCQAVFSAVKNEAARMAQAKEPA